MRRGICCISTGPTPSARRGDRVRVHSLRLVSDGEPLLGTLEDNGATSGLAFLATAWLAAPPRCDGARLLGSARIGVGGPTGSFSGPHAYRLIEHASEFGRQASPLEAVDQIVVARYRCGGKGRASSVLTASAMGPCRRGLQTLRAPAPARGHARPLPELRQDRPLRGEVTRMFFPGTMVRGCRLKIVHRKEQQIAERILVTAPCAW